MARLKILLSYWYYRTTDLDRLVALFPEPPEIFADSGAFSAMTQGVTIAPDDYAAWVTRWRHLFAVYANLDVIRDAEATWANQRYLEDRHGLAPLPVYHVLEDWAWLDRYLERYAYIALGVAGSEQTAYMPWLVRCFQRGRGRAVYHGFGITAWEPLRAFPWYSVDSSSWGQGFRYGAVPVFDPERGCWHKISVGQPASVYPLAHLIRRYGFDPADFADRRRYHRAQAAGLAACAYYEAEQWLRRLHGPIHLPARQPAESNPDEPAGAPSAAGAHVYLADTAAGVNLRHAAAGLRLHLAASTGETLAHGAEGLRLYLADADGPNLAEGAAGVHLYLADGTGGMNNHRDGAAGVHLYLATSQGGGNAVRDAAHGVGGYSSAR